MNPCDLYVELASGGLHHLHQSFKLPMLLCKGLYPERCHSLPDSVILLGLKWSWGKGQELLYSTSSRV